MSEFIFDGNIFEDIESNMPDDLVESFGWKVHSKEELREIINKILND